MTLPHTKRLSDAKTRMIELPFAIYESQDMLMEIIIKNNRLSERKKGIAVLGGVQVNTGPETLDYFVPLRFDFLNNAVGMVDDMLPALLKENIPNELQGF